MKKMLITLGIVGGLIILGIILGMMAIVYFADETEIVSITTLKTKSGYVFDIGIPGFWEATVPLSCTITKDKETIFSNAYIGNVGGLSFNKCKFALIESGKENDVVAIIEQANPQIVLAIYDVKNHKSWRESAAVRQELFEKLKQYTGKPFFWPGEIERQAVKEPLISH